MLSLGWLIYHKEDRDDLVDTIKSGQRDLLEIRMKKKINLMINLYSHYGIFAIFSETEFTPKTFPASQRQLRFV